MKYLNNLSIIAFSVWDFEKNTYQPFKQRKRYWEPAPEQLKEFNNLANEITESIEDQFLDECECLVDGDEVIVDYVPCLDNITEEHLNKVKEEYLLKPQELDWIQSEVFWKLQSEEELIDLAKERYGEDYGQE